MSAVGGMLTCAKGMMEGRCGVVGWVRGGWCLIGRQCRNSLYRLSFMTLRFIAIVGARVINGGSNHPPGP